MTLVRVVTTGEVSRSGEIGWPAPLNEFGSLNTFFKATLTAKNRYIIGFQKLGRYCPRFLYVAANLLNSSNSLPFPLWSSEHRKRRTRFPSLGLSPLPHFFYMQKSWECHWGWYLDMTRGWHFSNFPSPITRQSETQRTCLDTIFNRGLSFARTIIQRSKLSQAPVTGPLKQLAFGAAAGAWSQE